MNLWPKARAAGPDSDMHDPEPESEYDTYLEVMSIPSEADVGNPLYLWPPLFDISKYRDPINVLFEHIAGVSSTFEPSHVCSPL